MIEKEVLKKRKGKNELKEIKERNDLPITFILYVFAKKEREKHVNLLNNIYKQVHNIISLQ